MNKKQKYIAFGVLATAVVGVLAFFLIKGKEGNETKKGETINLIRE